MYLFNTTFYIDDAVMNAWQEWYHATYLPLMLSSGGFSDPLVYKVHSLHDEVGSSSIAVQFTVQTMNDIQQWEAETSQRVKLLMTGTFGETVLHFWTILEPLS
jgi:hypothetical protein